jgi:hypothetical protein
VALYFKEMLFFIKQKVVVFIITLVIGMEEKEIETYFLSLITLKKETKLISIWMWMKEWLNIFVEIHSF